MFGIVNDSNRGCHVIANLQCLYNIRRRVGIHITAQFRRFAASHAMPVVSALKYMDRHVYRRLSDLRTAFPAAYRPPPDLWNRPSDPRDSLLSLVGGGHRNPFGYSITTKRACDSCGSQRVNEDGNFFSVDSKTTQDSVDALLRRFTHPISIACVSCGNPALINLEQVKLPPVLLINARVINVGGCKVGGEVDPSLELRVGTVMYDLRAAVLKRRKHFFAVALTEDGWCVFDDHHVSRLPAFERPGGCDLALAFYTRRDGRLDSCLLGANGSITRCSQTTKPPKTVSTLIGADENITWSPSRTTDPQNTVTTLTNEDATTPSPAALSVASPLPSDTPSPAVTLSIAYPLPSDTLSPAVTLSVTSPLPSDTFISHPPAARPLERTSTDQATFAGHLGRWLRLTRGLRRRRRGVGFFGRRRGRHRNRRKLKVEFTRRVHARRRGLRGKGNRAMFRR